MALAYAHGPSNSQSTSPNICIFRLLLRIIKTVRPDFCFTSVRLNNNYSAAMHTDAGNQGPSVLMAFGEFEQGRIWVYEPGGPDQVEAPGPIRRFPRWTKGLAVSGRWHDPRYVNNTRGLLFNGHTAHMVEQFFGTRWSAVFFSIATDRPVRPRVRDTLRALGVPLPPALEGPRAGRFGVYYS